jgi:CDP-alcohol phosphatidyltransferase
MALRFPLAALRSVSHKVRYCNCNFVLSTRGTTTVREKATLTKIQPYLNHHDVVRLHVSTITFNDYSDDTKRTNRVQSNVFVFLNSIRLFANVSSQRAKKITRINASLCRTVKRENTLKRKFSIDAKEKEATCEGNASTNFLEQLKVLPNVITTARMMSSPLLAYWVVTNHVEYAVIGCVIAGISDVADGYIARNYNMTTTLGSYLDPLGMYAVHA